MKISDSGNVHVINFWSVCLYPWLGHCIPVLGCYGSTILDIGVRILVPGCPSELHFYGKLNGLRLGKDKDLQRLVYNPKCSFYSS